MLSWFGGGGKKTDQWTIPKWDDDKSRVQLSTALQYGQPGVASPSDFPPIFADSTLSNARDPRPAGTAAGLAPLAQFIYDFTARVYRPATSDFKTVINAGSTDAWGKIVTSLCNPGDGVLAEEWTYPCVLVERSGSVDLSLTTLFGASFLRSEQLCARVRRFTISCVGPCN